MNVLGIESSCDETAAAVVTDGRTIRSSVIWSQVAIHAPYGGVVPEIASRNHLQSIVPVVQEALSRADVTLADIDGLSVTIGPGLIGSLLVGVQFAKALALATGAPLVGVNHLEGHVMAAFLVSDREPPTYPFVALAVSGGHTSLYLLSAPGRITLLGRTRDDAAGEAFDKVGKMLGLPYPGGPEIERAARGGNPAAYAFPRSMLHDPHLDFSFSGLKTAVLYTLQREASRQPLPVADLAASFQQAVVEILVGKTLAAAKRSGHRLIALSGGVSLNQALRGAFAAACRRHRIELAVAPPALCTDNAAMIAFAALLRHLAGERTPLDADVHPNLPLVAP